MNRVNRSVSRLALGVLALALAAMPVAASADEELQQRDDIIIRHDNQFDAAHGVRSGTGTMMDPYVIARWHVGNIVIENTNRWIEIHDNRVEGRMILDWVGDRVHVMDNFIGDLRVNQNVPRTGKATSGNIVWNEFRVVGQLRHWSGVFAHNLVGTPDSGTGRQAVNFDGFHQGVFTDNTLWGFLDANLHGHHHGSSFTGPSHEHGGGAATHDPEGHEGGHDGMGRIDHTRRYHVVRMTNNRIYSTADFAIRFEDLNHAGDDRTAPSETDEALNRPHKHFTRVFITGNRLIGSGVRVDVFNSDDENHLGTKRGRMVIAGNVISLAPEDEGFQLFGGFTRDGIAAHTARDVRMEIRNNVIRGPAPVQEGELERQYEDVFTGPPQSAGIRLFTFDKSRIYVLGNSVTRRTFGVIASDFSDSVRWWVDNLRTQEVEDDVAYDSSVAHAPEGQP